MEQSVVAMLSGGDRKSLGRAAELVEVVLEQPSRFSEVVDGLRSDDPAVCGRCAYVLDHVSRQRPALLGPHKRALLGWVSRIDHWEARQALCVLLPRLELTTKQHDRAFEIARDYLEDESVFVRTFAMQALVDLSVFDPGLRAVVQPVIEQLTRSGTAAMRARGRKLLARMRVEG